MERSRSLGATESSQAERFEQELLQLHEKQEKIIDCIFVEKQMMEKKLWEAQKCLQENLQTKSSLEEKEKEILGLNASLEETTKILARRDKSLYKKDQENKELRNYLNGKKAEIKKKDFQLKHSFEKIARLEIELSTERSSQEKNKETRLKLEKKNQSQSNELEKLRNDASSKDAEIARLNSENLKKGSDIDSLYAKCMKKMTEVESVEEKCSKLEI